MGRVYLTTPLLFQSKILCLSLLYLLTTLPLALYVAFSQTGCLFRTPPPLPKPRLFAYPPSYGEHKYALPTTRSACSSPVPFSEYGAVLQEIRDLCRNSSATAASPRSPVLRYFQGKGDSFAGNFSAKKRMSFFNHTNGDRVEVPCGFLQEFPIRESDRSAMEKCDGVVVASAIFGDHDKIRQPKRLGGKTLETVCFFMFVDDATLRGLAAHNILTNINGEVDMIGAWRIVRVSVSELPYDNAAMNGVIPKHLVHRLFPNSMFSVWLDAKLQLTVDPLLLIHSLVVSKDADMAISKHPSNVHTMEEAMATARWKKWADVKSLRVQMETYCEMGLQPWSPRKHPYTTDVPDTALIIRRHGLKSNLFSCLLFNELEAFNPRDQLAFAYVRDFMIPKIDINMFESEVFEHIAMEYRHNLKRHDAGAPASTIKKASSRDIKGSSCEAYLLKMWGESND
ncbi:alkaline ceramidase TOD1-like [Musa acuminata AAA Group]|uniref:alkaline ceramidase TOD1-like n=1 Tax=Musa acuminata AAA Group TaxID=214697 RepID=UPI0031DA27D0